MELVCAFNLRLLQIDDDPSDKTDKLLRFQIEESITREVSNHDLFSYLIFHPGLRDFQTQALKNEKRATMNYFVCILNFNEHFLIQKYIVYPLRRQSI